MEPDSATVKSREEAHCCSPLQLCSSADKKSRSLSRIRITTGHAPCTGNKCFTRFCFNHQVYSAECLCTKIKQSNFKPFKMKSHLTSSSDSSLNEKYIKVQKQPRQAGKPVEPGTPGTPETHDVTHPPDRKSTWWTKQQTPCSLTWSWSRGDASTRPHQQEVLRRTSSGWPTGWCG